jgi:hypothetical protein
VRIDQIPEYRQYETPLQPAPVVASIGNVTRRAR